jgi:hypothetical protein
MNRTNFEEREDVQSKEEMGERPNVEEINASIATQMKSQYNL